MADSNGAHARPSQSQTTTTTTTSYPSPHSYPSPSMPPSYAYQAPSQSQSNNEQYRASPNAPGGQIGPLNLPPIHTIDGQNLPQPPPQQAGPPHTGAQLPPPNVHMGGAYYTQHQHSPSLPPPSAHMSASSPHNAHLYSAGVRYQLPPQQGDQRMMSGGRHKKEIKRRTKTGCLTCRKRRIKCDEAHPICNNCRKSKRDCAGYDPIFKQQPSPAQIQPAPTSAPTASAPAPVPPAPVPAPYSHIPQGYAPASNSSYPPPISSTAHPPPPPPPQPSTHEPYDFSAPIDPALGGPEHAAMPHDGQGSRPDPKGPFSNNGMYPGADRGFQGSEDFYIKKNDIKDLFVISNIPPPTIPPSHTIPADLSEVKQVFTNDYATGLDRMLDTIWFTHKGLDALLGDSEALAAFSYLIVLFRTSQTDYSTSRQIPSFEAQTIWQLLSLCRKAQPASTNGTSTSTTEDVPLQEAKSRLDILEHLITGHTKDVNPLLNLAYPNIEPSSDKYSETNFWKHLGTFITLRDDDSSSTKEIESVLIDMRTFLLMQENRDVIYSIAIVRHVGTRLANAPVQQTYNNTEEDENNKLYIAKRFLEEEAQNGMTQVIARVAGMAVRSWHVGR
ncbi:hypothetical protein EJ05DRAFT_496583 [Pseudovirgaria hyperparasitica]|uniref:Zn(2)-C6 fungal-type domain-containing protein n=1 Tax=Pseudovirgaria hyperparasitica TaxID=470096 RepID=A0A6A6WJT5_9PEZI|nr:uncharacterized protein EJ05DRAFT_496583 [Pseudovirgaria hyperparasitica]KAF2761681.1 hypothetical protein EJ05DRAFT_496583 [Pseudovirgaria hyperparasitica]